jgi:SnoaL-like domain
MAIHLPGPIEIFFESDKGREAEALATCFAADATVHDEGRTHEGLAAITAWKIEARRTYQYTVEPLEAPQRDGQTVVTASVSGNFPGSPVTLTFIFGLEGENIASLEIRP